MSRPRSELATRAIVGVALVAVALAVIVAGGAWFWGALALVGVLMIDEWARLVGVSGPAVRAGQALLVLPFLALAPFIHFGLPIALELLAIAAICAGLNARSAAFGAGLLYAGLPVAALCVLRAPPFGLVPTLWAMALVWVCDTGAYFGGRAIGGPKLAPRVSPNKTWAGFLSGSIAAGAFGLILHATAGLSLGLALASLPLAMLSQGGDLFESHLKRRAGVKDSGALLPGHGGLLDRLDGLVPVAPAAALCAIVDFWFQSGQFAWQ